MKVKHFAVFLAVLLAPVLMSAQSSTHPAASVYRQAHASVYPLLALSRHAKQVVSAGTAIAVGPSLVATNCHVLYPRSYYVVEVNKRMYRAKIWKKNRAHDLCLLRVPRASLTAVSIRRSKTVDVGEAVYALGNPIGSVKSITAGIVSNKVNLDGATWLQTDATISIGSSGGGLFDSKARLVGITTALQGRFGYALPTEWVLSLMKS